MLHQLSYQANQEQVVTWVDYKPVDVEMDDEKKILMWSSEVTRETQSYQVYFVHRQSQIFYTTDKKVVMK